MTIRIFLADDHELVRHGLRSVLETEVDMEVVGEAGDSQGAVEGCLSLTPDVLVLDLHMPGVGGVEVCRRVREQQVETSVLVLTSFDEDEELFGVLSAGASGYLLKDSRSERIIHAVRAVSEGEAVFDSAVVSRVIHGRPQANHDLAEPLSDREMEVLRHMAKGLSNKEIGRALWIGETTVKTHVSHILRKLDKADRTQAVLAAVREGLVRLER